MLSDLILQQKIAARKSVAQLKLALKGATGEERGHILKSIGYERAFLEQDFSKIRSVTDLYSALSQTRILCAASVKVAEEPIGLPGAPAENTMENPDGDVKPTYGNLLVVLEEEVNEELSRMASRRLPSQNDLRRWALKDAVLEFYKNMNLPADTKVVETVLDNRLVTQLAPDFDVLYKMWLQRLYDLTRRDDKYTLNSGEYDEAENDVTLNETGMRGSAFEKQLDRYREEFVEKLFKR